MVSPGSVQFIIFINNLHHGLEYAVKAYVPDDTILGMVANTLKDRISIQNDLEKIGK